MTVVFKLILLISFLGLVVIIAKNKFANPQMRIHFLDDWEKSRGKLSKFFAGIFYGKRLSAALGFIKNFVTTLSPYAKAIVPRVKQGVLFLYHKIVQGLAKLRSSVASQAKELKADMKSFEIPDHKQDFLDRLDGGTPVKDDDALALSEHTNKQESEVGPPLPEENPLTKLARSVFKYDSQEVKPVKEKVVLENVRGFQVAPLAQGDREQEGEVDAGILQKKERWLLYAIAKNPKNANFYKKLGRIYLQMNNIDDARNCFEYVLKLGSQDPEIKSLLSSMR